MNVLVIDGNSLINRAFYGIKLLTAKDGHYTNAIFGFLNMYLNLLERTSPEAVAVAFDLKAPTFRHERYTEYKAGRKPMPPELREQMEPIKEILQALGAHIVSKEGYEADDILGTISAHTAPEDRCYLATGDRDAFQLVRENVTVLLPSTKTGQTVTQVYTPQQIEAEFGVTPPQMIEIKALQGDSSDNIPGIPGVGPKTAGALIRAYGSVDALYADLENADVTAGVREKLRAGKESAYLSRFLGTICLDAPIEADPRAYLLGPRDDATLKAALLRHEMFKLIGKLGLKDLPAASAEAAPAADGLLFRAVSAEDLASIPLTEETVYLASPGNGSLVFMIGKTIFAVGGGEDALTACVERLIALKGWVTYDAKGLFRYCADRALPRPEIAFDVRLAGYLLNPNAADYAVETLAMDNRVPVPAIEGLPQEDGPIAAAAKTVSLLPLLTQRLRRALEDNGQLGLLGDMEIPLACVLADMEKAGMAVDRAAIVSYSDVLSEKIAALETKIHEAAGEVFNINSPKQLGVILFEKLGLPSKKKTKTGYSTNAEILEELAEDYPIVSMILEYRTYAKLKSTYCDGLLKAIAPDGRIHSTFNQTETRTGRLSSTEPNLQNIPVRTAVGREFRKFFTAAPGCLLVDADYSQIELRVLAALADDTGMQTCFNTGVDIHTATAAKVFGVPESAVTPELRSRAKAVNFGIVYGIGAFSLAKDIHVSRAEAERFIKAYLTLYSGVDAYMKRSIETAKKNGYAETLFHRRRYLPELTSANHMLRSFGERVARNMPIQGTAADIIKIAMIRIHDRLCRELPEVRLIMQVHDELILEAPEALADRAAAALKEEMENAVALSVKLSADAGAGKSWYEAKG